MNATGNSPTSALQAIGFGAGTLVSRFRHAMAHSSGTATAVTPELLGAVSHLRTHGFYVLPNYYSQEQCEILRGEIDDIFTNQPDVVQGDRFGADRRIFGIERASQAIAAYNQDTFPHAVGEAYGRRALKVFSTLAGRIEAVPGNIGSGQGWHRDAFHFQYKSLIYLTDVDTDHGPFQMLDGSHRATSVFKDTVWGRLPKAPYSRLTDEQVDKLIANELGRLKTFTASAGTMVLFDSSTIHRGMPINTGVRYALTNYYFEPDHITPAIEKAFAPFARPMTHK